MSIIYPTVPKPRTKRTYTIDGQQYPSVTEVLTIINKPSVNDWRARVGLDEATRIANTAAQLGTRVHALAADYALGKPVEVSSDDPVVPLFIAYQQWFDQAVREVVAVERTVHHPLFGYAGTTDLVCVLHGDDLPTVVDLKTSNWTAPEWALQTAAYARALVREAIPISRRLVVRLGKGEQAGEWHVHEHAQHDDDWFGFLAALQLYRWMESQYVEA